jgi:phenylalanyl-tRNA synthetase beta chain
VRVSMRWLEELVELPDGTSASAVGERLTLQGLEVEAEEDLAADLQGLQVARIVSFDKHPDADKLNVCTVESGQGKVQIVCGAKNFKAGDLVALAPVGVTLPGGLTIKKAKLRGVESHGMLCSEKELGLGTDHAGIMILDGEDGDLEVGMPLARALLRDDTVLEIGVTPNRPDALSHVGVAREVAAGFNARARLKAAQCAERGAPIDSSAHVTIKDPVGCPRYGCRVIEDVKVGPSPKWLRARLAACGVRAINNIVDVTNLVMMERGLPLHGFDLDRIGKDRDRAEVIIRSAEPGEKLTTLDDVERELVAEDLVIADPRGPIALAGVMGGASTEVTEHTTNVLLEAAYFDPGRVRKTARRLGLHSEASHRFERGCDPNGVTQSLDRAASLIAELGDGRVARGTIDVYPKKIQPGEVTLRPERAAALLGLPPKELDEATCSRLLLAIGLEIAGRDGEGMRLRVPTFRPDLTREIDLVEELLRLIGYDKVPETLPNRSGEAGALFDSRRSRAERLTRRALRAAGFHEAVNLAFTSPEDDKAFAPVEQSEPVSIDNPLGEEMSLLRRSLLPGLVRNASINHRRGTEDVRLFEMGTVFLGKNDEGQKPALDREGGPAGSDRWAHEAWRCAGIMTGYRRPAAFDRAGEPADFYDLKGVIEEVFAGLGIDTRVGMSTVLFTPFEGGPGYLHPRSRCRLSLRTDHGDVAIGVMGELHPDEVARAELHSSALVFELDTQLLSVEIPERPIASPLPRFPGVRRDLALVVDDAVPVAALSEKLAQAREVAPLLEDLSIFDVYKGEHVPDGKKSVALSVFLRAPDRTLTDAEIAAASDALVACAKSEFGAEIRS